MLTKKFLLMILLLECHEWIQKVEALNERPIIGIVAQEKGASSNGSYIPSSYVKAVESAGARVVPIFIDRSEEYYRDMLMKLNGIVFPGGNVNLTANTGFARAAKIIFNLATEWNDQKDHYPILGVCQGLEILAILTNNDTQLLRSCPGMEDKALPIRFKSGYRRSSLYGVASRKDITILSKTNSTANFHHSCLTEKNLTKTGLDKYWRVLTVNKDAEDEEFISSMEAFRYPYVALQFHPEKVAYEWMETHQTPHRPEAVKANRLFYDWLVQEARQNRHRFNVSDEEVAALIYNYQPVFTEQGGDFQQQYEFPV